LLYRVEQCLGLIEERLHTVEAPKTFNSRRRFEPPISRRSSVVFASRYLFEDLRLQLGLANKRAKYFHITIEESDGRSTKKELALASATSDFMHFFSVVEPIIEGMNFSEEVSCIEVSARDIEDARSEQKSLSSHESEGFADSRQREELLNNFAVRIGKDRVLRALLHQSYVPERSYSYDSMLNESPVEALAERSLPYTLDERPSIIYPHPEPISTIAMLPDRPPSFVHWKSRKLKVLSGIGPERIAPEWWIGDLLRQQFAERDYFKIQDEFGRWLWVYRDQKTLEWFVHGLWT
jgi:protein ImuB